VAVHGGARHWPGHLHEGLGTSENLPARDAATVDYLIEQDILTQDAAEAWLTESVAKFSGEVAHVG
jgi:hypothetical protein